MGRSDWEGCLVRTRIQFRKATCDVNTIAISPLSFGLSMCDLYQEDREVALDFCHGWFINKERRGVVGNTVTVVYVGSTANNLVYGTQI